jgi:hypothetical protein
LTWNWSATSQLADLVGPSDDLDVVPVGIVEEDAAATAQAVDLTGTPVTRPE